jgi:hypothetical protein
VNTLSGIVCQWNRPISVTCFPRQALTLCPQLCMGIQPDTRCPARSADALPAALCGHFTQAIYRNRPVEHVGWFCVPVELKVSILRRADDSKPSHTLAPSASVSVMESLASVSSQEGRREQAFDRAQTTAYLDCECSYRPAGSVHRFLDSTPVACSISTHPVPCRHRAGSATGCTCCSAASGN